MRNNKRGGAKLYILLAVLALIVIAVVWRIIKLNWARFKVEADFALTLIAIVAVLLLIIILVIWISIKRAKRKKEKERARIERERLEQERIAAGIPPKTLGNGKLEASDFTEAAGKAAEKIDEFLSKGNSNEQ